MIADELTVGGFRLGDPVDLGDGQTWLIECIAHQGARVVSLGVTRPGQNDQRVVRVIDGKPCS